MNTYNLKIDGEFQNFLEPLAPEEFNTLEQNILTHGCLDSIQCWGNTIIDGHNRYNICTKHNINFTTSSIEFENKDEAKIYILKNQFGRRNWDTYTTSTKALLLEEMISEKAKNNQLSGLKKGHIPVCQNSDKRVVAIDTKKEIAKIAGVSHDTIAKVKYINTHADEETKEKLKTKQKSIDKAYKEVKNKEYKKKEAKLKNTSDVIITKENMPKLYNCDILEAPIEDNSIDIIITDPPYPREFIPCWTKLAQFAVKKLKTNGVLIALSGHSYLPDVYKNMTIDGLDYYWTGCIYQPGQSANLNVKQLRTNWKPYLIYVKGKYKRTFQGSDVYVSEYKDIIEGQDYHKWGQNLEVFKSIVNDYTYKEDVICDPFLGGGTTALAVIKNKRDIKNFIGIELDKETKNVASNRIYEAL